MRYVAGPVAGVDPNHDVGGIRWHVVRGNSAARCVSDGHTQQQQKITVSSTNVGMAGGSGLVVLLVPDTVPIASTTGYCVTFSANGTTYLRFVACGGVFLPCPEMRGARFFFNQTLLI